jgi:osmoprotectant transport system permease protein
LDYAEANNTFCLMMTEERAKELEMETISDLAKYINSKNN